MFANDVAQWRQIDADAGDTAIEVGAEPMCVHVGVDPRRGARHDAERRGDGQPVDAHLAVARDPREARLGAGRQIGDVA